MRYPAFVRAAAVALSAVLVSSGAVLAQTRPQPATMTDVAPLPASERSSNGAVILVDEPVLAQKEAMEKMAARAPDTRALGAGPARVLQQQQQKSQEDLEFERALERAMRKHQ